VDVECHDISEVTAHKRQAAAAAEAVAVGSPPHYDTYQNFAVDLAEVARYLIEKTLAARTLIRGCYTPVADPMLHLILGSSHRHLCLLCVHRGDQ